MRPAARETTGTHIAELIKTMLEKKASGIDLQWGTDASTGRASHIRAFRPAGKTLMPGEFSLPERIKEALGGPVRPAAQEAAGARIAKLIKTMLEKRASGIDLE